tara:strand:+ start:2996 stop:3823 length:828 start_codon:yes stop_codon:yes gene_type:complete
MAEKPKRLAPKLDVLRELFLKSGNECAFPNCHGVMIDSEGTFVGEICHIEGALPGGERFNPNQCNEDRRQFSNLMLMCHPHHKKSDDVDKFPVEELQSMKAAHERKFSDIARTIQRSISDVTDVDELTPCKTLKRINALLNWGNGEDELVEVVGEINGLGETLGNLPPATRQLFAIIVKRASKPPGIGTGDLVVSAHEIEHVASEHREVLAQHIQMLDHHGLIGEGFADDFGFPQIEVKQMPTGWPFFPDLKKFCRMSGVKLTEIIVDLNFEALD